MRYLVLLTPFIAAAIALSMRDRLKAMIVFFAYLSVEGFLKLVSNYHPVVHIGSDIMLLSVVGIWIAVAVLRRDTRLPRVPFVVPLILHMVWIVLLVFSPYTASIFVGVASWKVHLTMIPLYFVGYLIAADREAPRKFMHAMIIIWAAAFLVTVLQFTGGPGGVFDLGQTYMARLAQFHEWRPFGTTALPGGEALYAMFALSFAICLVLRGDYGYRYPWIIATLAGSLIVFFVSGVRQVFLSALMIVFTMVALQIIRGRGRAAGALLVLVVVGGGSYMVVREYILPEAQASIAEATGVPEIWRERNTFERFETLLEKSTYTGARRGGFAMIWDRVTAFPFGAGLGRTGSAAAAFGDQLTKDPLGKMIQDKYGFQDNFYAAMLVETGLPGTLLLTAIAVGLVVIAVRVARRARDQQDSAFGSLVAGYIVALLITSWGSQPLLANPTLAFFWFLAGMLARRYHAMLEQTDEPAEQPEAVPVPQPG